MSEGLTVLMVDQENKVEMLLEQEQKFWRQKARVKWDNDNDRSTKFFHAQANLNRSRSTIMDMKNYTGDTMDSQEEIGSFLVAHYSEKFKKVEHDIDWDLIGIMP
ncbi:hypothetical protein IFM89_032038 [Coptis chinensis]|uniref:Uncharacterized protein n=1 Tax=Coptis chinensis TaxID=261450 RepID=A0A835LD83_9MAGN|nr:hypothetical protein IFM89_032038 [Coptis chinensis]